MSFSNQFATPYCIVDIYPFEGGAYTLSGDNGLLLTCSVNQPLRGGGTFTLQLAPGGPLGPNASPEWQDILTPGSLTVIAMQRGQYARIVMIGVVRSCSASQEWATGRGIARGITVEGQDFSYFFYQNTSYVQALLNETGGVALGIGGALSVIDAGLVQGTPATVGQQWYQKIMIGPSSVMGQTSLAYQGGRQSLYSLIGYDFEEYESGSALTIPLGDTFVYEEGPWINKFYAIFPFPFYELILTTVDQGYYPGTPASFPIYSSSPYFPAANPQIVARTNPLPWMQNIGDMDNADYSWNSTLWDNLDVFTLDTLGPLAQNLTFGDAEVRNYYVVNITWLSQLQGATNAQAIPFATLYGTWIDQASIRRYGYRPQITNLGWFYDPSGQQAQKNANTSQQAFEALVSDVATRQTSYFEPAALMMRGTVVTNLRPDIIPGNQFVFQPYKQDENWTFYIEGLSHSYVFGRNCTTTIQLSRGLPSEVYQDQDLMIAIHTGNAMRQDGQYQIGIPSGLGQGLEPVNFKNMQTIMSQLGTIFHTP